MTLLGVREGLLGSAEGCGFAGGLDIDHWVSVLVVRRDCGEHGQPQSPRSSSCACWSITAAAFISVHFRYVVFHPFLDEILIGKIKGCSPEGVHVSLGFFDDILIPPESLQQPAKFDEAEQVWVWEYETEEGAHDLYMDTGEEIRFRVVDESFVDTSPTGPSSAEATSSSEELPKKEAPYTLVGSISEPGLGLLSWWTSN
ncbi:DNA-directed RNA polymerase III subunit RPC8 isoform 2-T2 [Callospermophilus lateralis]